MTGEQRDFIRRQIDAQVRERVEHARRAQASARALFKDARSSQRDLAGREAPERPRIEPSAYLAAREEIARSVRALRAGKEELQVGVQKIATSTDPV